MILSNPEDTENWKRKY